MKYISLLATYTWKHWLVTYVMVAFFSSLPLFSVIVGSLLGKFLGCNDAGEDCLAGRGQVIPTLLMMGWLGLVTFPFGGFLIMLLIIANVLWYFTRKSGVDISS